MTRPMTPARRPVVRAVAHLAVVALLVGCGAPAATAGPTTEATLAVATSSAPVTSPSPLATLAVAATTAPTIAPATEPPVTTPPTAPPTAAPTSPPPSVAPAIGVALRVGDEQLMTVLAAEEWPGAPGVKPAKGKAFFTVSIRIDALALTSWDSADFKLRDADRSYAWRTGRSPHLYDGANLTVGNNYVGWITYEIPKASTDKLTLVYKPAFLDAATFRVPLFP